MRKFRKLIPIVLSLAFTLSYPTLVYANTDEKTEIENVPLTPEGNLTLVDDVTTSDSSDKQFITAVTKNGNFFYLVIDRANNKDNVYLLNLVDEEDLLDLMGEAKVAVQETTPVQIETPVIEEVIEEVVEEQPAEEKKSNSLSVFMTFIILIGGGAFYYYKFGKGGSGNKGDTNINELDDDFDEKDDEVDYEVEDNLEDYYENDEL